MERPWAPAIVKIAMFYSPGRHGIRVRRMKVAVIGGGKIGEAVASRLVSSDAVDFVTITRRAVGKAQLRGKKVKVTDDNESAAAASDVIILSVKPGDAHTVFRQIAHGAEGKLVISLMAAITTGNIEKALPRARVVRAMPNIAALIGEAITAYCEGTGVTHHDLSTAETILSTFGETIHVTEKMMDAVTALSGSGPAYIALLIEAMVSAGLKVGLPRDTAFKLATKTLTGTAGLLRDRMMHPAELRDTVTTPAGTTIAGIYELEKGSVRTAMMNAVEAATLAARQISKEFEGREEAEE